MKSDNSFKELLALGKYNEALMQCKSSDLTIENFDKSTLDRIKAEAAEPQKIDLLYRTILSAANGKNIPFLNEIIKDIPDEMIKAIFDKYQKEHGKKPLEHTEEQKSYVLLVLLNRPKIKNFAWNLKQVGDVLKENTEIIPNLIKIVKRFNLMYAFGAEFQTPSTLQAEIDKAYISADLITQKALDNELLFTPPDFQISSIGRFIGLMRSSQTKEAVDMLRGNPSLVNGILSQGSASDRSFTDLIREKSIENVDVISAALWAVVGKEGTSGVPPHDDSHFPLMRLICALASKEVLKKIYNEQGGRNTLLGIYLYTENQDIGQIPDLLNKPSIVGNFFEHLTNWRHFEGSFSFKALEMRAAREGQKMAELIADLSQLPAGIVSDQLLTTYLKFTILEATDITTFNRLEPQEPLTFNHELLEQAISQALDSSDVKKNTPRVLENINYILSSNPTFQPSQGIKDKLSALSPSESKPAAPVAPQLPASDTEQASPETGPVDTVPEPAPMESIPEPASNSSRGLSSGALLESIKEKIIKHGTAWEFTGLIGYSHHTYQHQGQEIRVPAGVKQIWTLLDNASIDPEEKIRQIRTIAEQRKGTRWTSLLSLGLFTRSDDTKAFYDQISQDCGKWLSENTKQASPVR